MDAITGIQTSLARKAKELPTHRFGDLWPLLCRVCGEPHDLVNSSC